MMIILDIREEGRLYLYSQKLFQFEFHQIVTQPNSALPSPRPITLLLEPDSDEAE